MQQRQKQLVVASASNISPIAITTKAKAKVVAAQAAVTTIAEFGRAAGGSTADAPNRFIEKTSKLQICNIIRRFIQTISIKNYG